MTYSVVEIFPTLQGEGIYSGTPAIFVRFAGCNLWSGHDDDRPRDHHRSHGAYCPLWCDTDFRKGTKLDLHDMENAISDVVERTGWTEVPLLVFTGGEPLLQLDVDLVSGMGFWSASPTIVAIETNGTVKPKKDLLKHIDHVCVSPKLPPDKLALLEGDEIKLVWPAYDPADYEKYAEGFDYRFISPLAKTSSVGSSLIQRDIELAAVQYCLKHPKWRLSLQSHKHLQLP